MSKRIEVLDPLEQLDRDARPDLTELRVVASVSTRRQVDMELRRSEPSRDGAAGPV